MSPRDPLGSGRARDIDQPVESKVAESGLRAKSRAIPILKSGVREHRLDRPELTLGRSATCDIQVTSALVSRRHALLRVSEHGVTIEDLGSRNGVYVNAQKIEGATRLNLGDRLGIGDETLLFYEADEAGTTGTAPTVAALPAQRTERDSFSDDDTAFATRSADVFQLLAHVVDKALALGRGDEAEHLLGTHLHTALADATSVRGLSPDLARTAAGYAIKLAGATGRPSWLDYAVRLYHALDLVLPLVLVDEMYVLLRRVRGLDLSVLRAYTDSLRGRAHELAPAERFVLQRLIGLERLAAWQTTARSR